MKQKPSQALHAKRWKTALSVGLGASILAALSGCGGDSPVAQVVDLRGSIDATFNLNNAGQIAWLQEDDDLERVYLDGMQLASFPSSQGQLNVTDKLSLNDVGQVVWVAADASGYDSNIYLYDGGKSTPIADGYDVPHSPDINNKGQVVFVDQDGDGAMKVVLYESGRVSMLTDGDNSSLAPQINGRGEVSWLAAGGGYFLQLLYQGGAISQLNDIGMLPTEDMFEERSLHERRLNNRGQVVWATDVPDDDHQDIVYFYNGYAVIELKPMMINRNPSVNNSGQVVWQGWDGNDYEIFLYDGSQIMQLTDNDADDEHPLINDGGGIVWVGSDGHDQEIYTYNAGDITQVTDNEEDDYAPQINDQGVVAWIARGVDGGLLGLYRARPGTGHVVHADAGFVVDPLATPWVQNALASNNHLLAAEIDHRAAEISPNATGEQPIYKFAVLGDSRYAIGWIPQQPKFPKGFLKDLTKHIKETHNPNAVFFVGDMATYPVATSYTTDPCASDLWMYDHLGDWFNNFKANLGAVPVYPVLGNHETFRALSANIKNDKSYLKSKYKWQEAPALHSVRTFHKRNPGNVMYFGNKVRCGDVAVTDSASYYWDTPDSRFIVVNFYTATTTDAGFIPGDLKNSVEVALKEAQADKKHIFVFGHVPIYHNPGEVYSGAKAFSDMLHKYGVRAYFSGHAHYYRHAVSYHGDTNDDSSYHEIVTGAAGADLTKVSDIKWIKDISDSQYHAYSVAARFNYAIVEVYANGDVLVATFVTEKEYRICHGYGYNPKVKDLPFSCLYMGFPKHMVRFERFYVAKGHANVRDEQEYCGGDPDDTIKLIVKNGDVWCGHDPKS